MSMKMGRLNLGILLISSSMIFAGTTAGIAAARPRQQGDSLAEAARRAQSEKKSAPATQKVWTNENIPTTPGTISIVGVADTSSSADSAAGDSAKPAAPSNSANKPRKTDKDAAAIQSDLAAAKLDLNTLTTDLDILTRKQILDSQSYYSKPGYASDTAGAAQLSDEQAEVDAKKQEVADAQKKVNDLQDQLAAASSDSGGASDSSRSTPTPTPTLVPPSDDSSTSPAPATPPTPPAAPDSNPPAPSKKDPNYRPGE
jgi:hypothetical protein